MFCGVPIKGSDLKRYQSRHLCSNDYYEKGKSVEGQWVGKNLARFGLAPGMRVESEAFSEMADGRQGDMSGESWLQRHGRERRPFYDFTISAPKSFSAVCIVGGDERIKAWHKEAVSRTLKAVECDMMRRVRTKGSIASDAKRTGNLVAARYHHDASRMLDPQLHDHICIFNGTVDPDDGKIYAVEYGAIMDRSRLYTAIYRHALADLAIKGGYDVVIDADGVPELPGLEDARKSLSGRTYIIEKVSSLYRETCGIELSKRQRKSVSLISRGTNIMRFCNAWKENAEGLRKLPLNESFQRMTALLRDCGGNAKITEITTDKVRFYQKIRLGEENLDLISQTIEKAERQNAVRAPGTELREGGCISVADALRLAIDSTFETKSVAHDYELIEKAMRLAPISESSHSEISSMLERAIQSGFAIRSDSGLITTAETLRMEGSLLERAKKSQGKLPAIKSLILNPSVSMEQRDAVCGVLKSGDKISAIVGDAGTGKTFATGILVKAFLDAQVNVQFLAPTTGARDVLRGSAPNGKRVDVVAAFNGAQTLQRILHDYAFYGKTGLLKDSCIILDEAGMVSVKMMSQLVDICEKEGHRLVLIGDYKQHAPVEAGGAFRLLVQSGAVRSYRISKIRRQSKEALGGAYHTAASLMAAGKIEEAFRVLDKAGAIIELQGVERINAIAKSYIDSLKAGRTCLCVNYTHRENDAVSARIREMLKSEGVLKAGRKFVTFRPLNMSNADKVAANIRPGMWIVEHPGTPKEHVWAVFHFPELKNGICASDRHTTKDFSDADLKSCLICDRREIEISAGDSLTLRATLKNGRSGLANGSGAMVAGWTSDGFPIDESGNELRTRLLDYGYATTSHKSQGSTCDDVIIGFDYRSTTVADAKMAYVAATRGRGSIKIFCDSKEDLSLVARRSGDAPLAVEAFFKVELQRKDAAPKTAHPIEGISAWANATKDEIMMAIRRLKGALSIKSKDLKRDIEDFFPLPKRQQNAPIFAQSKAIPVPQPATEASKKESVDDILAHMISLFDLKTPASKPPIVSQIQAQEKASATRKAEEPKQISPPPNIVPPPKPLPVPPPIKQEEEMPDLPIFTPTFFRPPPPPPPSTPGRRMGR